jgi:hypothetical protein
MLPFKILADKLPLKWQVELMQVVSGETAAAPIDVKTAMPVASIEVNSGDAQVIEALVDWIRRMNRLQKSEKTYAGLGINLKLEKNDGARILLNERNGAVVKQFLGK